jgi:hypothetical protein
MSCEKVQEQISLMLDQQLVSEEWQHSLEHMQSCRRCEAHADSARRLRAGLRQMAHTSVPRNLTDRLRVVASHERSRQIARANFSARLRDWTGTVRLFVDNLMRPFAVPVTGGLFSAFVLFSFLVPSLMFHRSYTDEPPIAVLTDPEGEIVSGSKDFFRAFRLEPGDATISGNEISLVLLIDERGHVQDYYLSGGELTDEMKSLILLSRFTPATIYGQPTWGLKQVVFQHSRRLRS